MRDLVGIFEAAGAHDVRTYIQSGNVIFRSEDAASAVASAAHELLVARTGLAVPIVLRGRAEFETMAANNPFLDHEGAPRALHVAFLAKEPDRATRDRLDPERSPGDAFELRGRDVYLHCPNGMARSKLTTAFFDRGLETTSTVRNWRTVLALRERLAPA